MKRFYNSLILALVITAAICCFVLATVSSNVGLSASVSGLGSSSINLSTTFTPSDPDAYVRGYRQLSDANTAEQIDMGDLSTVLGMIVAADACDCLVDPNFVSSFKAGVIIKAGESAFFRPAGTVYIKNEDSGETPKYEYLAFGTR